MSAPAGAQTTSGPPCAAGGRYLAAAYSTSTGSLLRLWDLESRQPALPDLPAGPGPLHKVLLDGPAGRMVWRAKETACGSGIPGSRTGWPGSAGSPAAISTKRMTRFLPYEPYRPACARYGGAD